MINSILIIKFLGNMGCPTARVENMGRETAIKMAFPREEYMMAPISNNFIGSNW
jgi:competence protein ComGC